MHQSKCYSRGLQGKDNRRQEARQNEDFSWFWSINPLAISFSCKTTVQILCTFCGLKGNALNSWELQQHHSDNRSGVKLLMLPFRRYLIQCCLAELSLMHVNYKKESIKALWLMKSTAVAQLLVGCCPKQFLVCFGFFFFFLLFQDDRTCFLLKFQIYFINFKKSHIGNLNVVF